MNDHSSKLQTVMTTNGGYDSILLIDEHDRVLSAWTADQKTVTDYMHDTDAQDWHTDCWPIGGDPDLEDNEELRTIEAYGQEIGRNGQMTEERRTFWFR